jgi:pimeloyl-ACP methyl ester carboxylesterase
MKQRDLHLHFSFSLLTLFLVLFLAAGGVQAQMPPEDGAGKPEYGDNPNTGHSVMLRGIRIYYETYGKGQPLLFIHGNGGSINNFRYNIPFFAKDYKVIAVDSRAQGKSTDKGDSLSYEMMADDFNALLDFLHLDSCFVIGWSDGGIDGLLLAIRHPEKVKKLAITGANLRPDTTGIDPYFWYQMIEQIDILNKTQPAPDIRLQIKLLTLMRDQPHITAAQLHTIACPTLVIGGDHDIIPPAHTLEIAQGIRQSYLWIIPNSGHSTPINHADLFNRTIREFFAKPYRVIEGGDCGN